MKNAIKAVKTWAARPDVQDYIDRAHRTVQAVGEFVPIKNIPAMSAVASAIGIANKIINHAPMYGGEDEIVKNVLMKRGYIQINAGPLGELLVKSGVFEKADILKNISKIAAFEVTTPNGQLVFVTDTVTGHNYGVYTKGMPQSALLDLLWSCVGPAVKLECRKPRYASRGDLSLVSLELPHVGMYVPGAIRPEELVRNVRLLHQSDASPAYILNGPPGCGKTSFCFQVATLMGGRCFLVASDVLKSAAHFGEMTELVTIAQPNVIIFDDVDGCNSDKELLSTVSSIRRALPKALIISTCNEWQQLSPALRRPGRLGMKIDFTAPDLEGRRKILAHYGSVYGVDRDLSWIADLTEHPLLTQDYLIDIVQQAVLQDDEGVRRHVAATLEHLKATTEENRE